MAKFPHLFHNLVREGVFTLIGRTQVVVSVHFLVIGPELHIFVAYGVFFGVFVLVVGFWGGGFGSLIGGGVFG